MQYGDRFESQVYRDEATDQFLIIDCYANPTVESWVMVKRLSAIEIIIEPFRGQPFIGVVKVLEFYQLAESEQWAPRSHALALQLFGLAWSIVSTVMSLAM